MASPAPPTPADRAISFVGLVLITAGIFGATSGISEATSDRVPPPPVMVSQPTVPEARQAFVAKMTEVLFHARFRQALGATNALLSVLMIVGGGMLLARQPLAPWLALNAVIAKALWTLGDAASRTAALWEARTDLQQYIVSLHAASTGGDKDVSLAMEPTVGVLLSAIIVLGFLGWVAWRLRRPDIRNLGAK